MSRTSLLLFSGCILLGCPFDFDPGEAPDVVVEPAPAPAECDRQNDPLEGSCLGNLGEACFEPVGACVAVSIPPGAGLQWENGSVLSFQPSATNPGVKEITAYAPDGTVCFSALSAIDPGGAFVRTRFEEASGTGYALVEETNGSVQITCPDGKIETMTVADFHLFYQCLYGGDGGGCDFGAVAVLLASARPPTTAIGACSNNGDCPSGTLCCGEGTRGAYCSPLCL